MTKIFCDRCKREITKKKHTLMVDNGEHCDMSADLCEECFKDLGDFMDGRKIDNYSDPILHRDNHGIERSTFGAK